MLVVVKDANDKTCFAYDATARRCSYPALTEVADVECVMIDALIALRSVADRREEGAVVH